MVKEAQESPSQARPRSALPCSKALPPPRCWSKACAAPRKPSRDKIHAALEGLKKFDLGGLEGCPGGPDDHTGLDFADLSIIGISGKFRR